MAKEIVNMKRLPEYVFNKDFEQFLYVIFSESNHNQISEFLKVLCSVIKEEHSRKLLCFEIKESKIIFRKEFDLLRTRSEDVADFFRDFEDENGIPYFLFLAMNIFFVDEKEIISVYSDREFDVSIIGCSKSIYNKIKEKQTRLRFIDLNEYLTYVRKWMDTEVYNRVEKELLKNYGRFFG